MKQSSLCYRIISATEMENDGYSVAVSFKSVPRASSVFFFQDLHYVCENEKKNEYSLKLIIFEQIICYNDNPSRIYPDEDFSYTD